MECFLFPSIEALSARLEFVGAFRLICWISFLKLKKVSLHPVGFEVVMLVAEKLSVLFRDLEFTEAVDVELSDERVHIVVLKVARKHLF